MTTPRGDCDQLGCCNTDDTQVIFTYRCGSPSVCVADNMTDVSYGRVLDAISTAQVTVSVAGALADCCDCLSELRTWCHEVHVYRCGEEQWSGPITKLTYRREQVIINASDIIAWLDRQPVVAEVDIAVDTDIAEVARQVIAANITIGTDAGCITLQINDTGILTDDFLSEPGTGSVLSELERLRDDYGLHFTAVGRRLVLFGEQPLSLLGTLTDEDFTGDLSVIENGSDATTFAQVTNAGGEVLATAEVPGVCGRLGSVVATELEDEEDAEQLADRIVAGGYPTPLRVEVPPGAALSPEAPICLNEMIPGVDVRVVSTATCREAQADLRLVSVQVQTGPENESVQVTMAPASLVPVG